MPRRVLTEEEKKRNAERRAAKQLAAIAMAKNGKLVITSDELNLLLRNICHIRTEANNLKQEISEARQHVNHVTSTGSFPADKEYCEAALYWSNFHTEAISDAMDYLAIRVRAMIITAKDMENIAIEAQNNTIQKLF